jgi:hypothetical protein
MVTGYTKYINNHGGVITWDVPVSKDGRLPESFLKQLVKING